MKKFYFFLVAMMLGIMSASAVDYCLAGGFNNWNKQDDNAKFTKVSDTEYVLDYKGTLTSGFKVKSFESGWNDTYNWGAPSTSDLLSLDKPFTLKLGNSGKNINFAGGITVDNPHIVFNPEGPTLTISGQKADATITYAICGNLPAGGSNWSQTELENVAGTDKWTIEGLEVTAKSDFGLRYLENGNPTKWIWSPTGATISTSGSYPCVFNEEAEGSDFAIEAGTWDLTFDAKAMTITAKKTGEGEDVTITYCLHGNIKDNGGMAWSDIELTNSSADIWEIKGLEVNTPAYANDKNKFGIRRYIDGTENGWYASTTAVTISATGSFDVTDQGPTDFVITAGVYDIAFDANAMKLNVTKTGGDDPEPTPELPATLYILGNICDWIPANGVECDSAVDGVYTWNEANLVAAAESEYSYFSFATAIGADWDADVNSSHRYGATSENAELVTEAPIELFPVGGNATAYSWKVKAGTYKVVANLNDMKVTISGTNSVEAIDVEENAAPVYYNLQGVRVDAPANGLYIVVRGNKVAKEIVK